MPKEISITNSLLNTMTTILSPDKKTITSGTGQSYVVGSPEASKYLLESSAAMLKDPTVGEAYKTLVAPANDTSVGEAIDTGINTYGAVANTPVNEDAVRSRTLQQFQAEIDATNAIYAEKLREAKVQGLSRLGTGTAISARSGTLGSDFAVTQNETIKAGNTAIEGGINAERMAKIASVLNTASSAATAEIAAKRKAQQEGLDSYIKFLGAKTERKSTGLKTIANALITQKLDPSEVDPAELKKIAESYGVSVDELKASFTSEKVAYDTALKKTTLENEKLAGEAAKAGMLNVGEGDAIYQQQSDGSYKYLGKNPKTSAPGSGLSSKNVLTGAEAIKRNLPQALVGASEETVIAQLDSSDIPQWFAEKANNEARQSLPPEQLGPLWDTYRQTIKDTYKSTDDLTSSINALVNQLSAE